MSALPIFESGTTINDRYELQTKLGKDGAVYRAHDRHLDKDVALKILQPKPGAVAQPWHEAQRLEQLRSRCLVEVINADVVTDSDIRYMVTPLIEGGDLASKAADIGISVSEAVLYIRQVAAGIDRIHRAGMVHRDIKPANVLLQGDGVLVSDLEFCETLDQDGKASPNGSFCTVAPETVQEGGYCSVRSDVYSLAATAYYLFAGDYPVSLAQPPLKVRDLILHGGLRNLSDLAPHVPQSVATVVRKALNLDPEQRHVSADEFGNALVHAARDRRNWQRVTHPGHAYCLQGAEHGGRSAVAVCSIPNDEGGVSVSTRLASGRRAKGIDDFVVKPADLSRRLKRLVKAVR